MIVATLPNLLNKKTGREDKEQKKQKRKEKGGDQLLTWLILVN